MLHRQRNKLPFFHLDAYYLQLLPAQRSTLISSDEQSESIMSCISNALFCAGAGLVLVARSFLSLKVAFGLLLRLFGVLDTGVPDGFAFIQHEAADSPFGLAE